MTIGKGLWTFVGALVVLLLVVSWSWSQSSGKLKTAAVVGKKTISDAEWVAALKEKYGQQVLKDMINREVVFQEAERLGVTVDPERLKKELEQIRESYGSQTEAEFEQALKKQAGTTVEALTREITYQLLLRELATKEVSVPEEQIQAFYNNNPERFTQPLQVHIRQIAVASREEADRVLAELKQGANFQTLAKERSIDSATAAGGGDMGWVTLEKSDLTDEAKKLLADLKKGTVSSPVKQDDEYVIYQAVERREAKKLTFDQVKDELREEIAFAQVESLDAILERLRESAGVEANENGQKPH